jgi:hypothetical protein
MVSARGKALALEFRESCRSEHRTSPSRDGREQPTSKVASDSGIVNPHPTSAVVRTRFPRAQCPPRYRSRQDMVHMFPSLLSGSEGDSRPPIPLIGLSPSFAFRSTRRVIDSSSTGPSPICLKTSADRYAQQIPRPALASNVTRTARVSRTGQAGCHPDGAPSHSRFVLSSKG